LAKRANAQPDRATTGHGVRYALTMISHLSLGVSDLDRSGAFYDAALEALGYVRVWGNPRGIGYGPPGGNDKLALFPASPPAVVASAGPGFHLAFAAPDRAAVDRFHSAALASGATCNGPPGLRPHYGATYYAAFVIDPDGHKLEAKVQ